MERVDRLESPRLALLSLRLGPENRLPVGCQHQPGAGIGDLDAIAARLVHVEEERLLDRVLVRPGLDVNTALQEDVGRAQDLLAGSRPRR